jgi:hypothetical protein
MDGSIKLSFKGATLVFSYIGFISQEAKVTGGTLSVSLRRRRTKLVVVTTMGISSGSRSLLGYANQTIKAADIDVLDS